MRDYSMELVKIAAGIVSDVMGNDLKADVRYTTDGNHIVMVFDGYPLYGKASLGKVMVMFPRSTFYIRKGKVCFEPLQQAQCHYYQENLQTQFAHPHIYNDGHPCWDGSSRERPTDFISNIVETLTLLNVTNASVTIGRCASGIMGVGGTALENAKRQQQRVKSQLNHKPIANERRELEKYVTKRWRNKITILIRTL